MGIKSSSQQRITAKSALSSAIVASANPTGGILVTGQGLTANTVISQEVVVSGQTNASSTVAVGATPTNVTPAWSARPVITGTLTCYQTLTCSTGTWVSGLTISYTYQWYRSGSAISGATAYTYSLTSADAGNTLYCIVTATNSIGSATSVSATTSTVAAAVPRAPTSVSAVSSGTTTAAVTFTAPDNGGATITSYTATSSPGGITSTLSQAGSGTITVSGLTSGSSYTFTVTATNSVGTSSASSPSTSITEPTLLYTFTTFTFTNAGGTVYSGPTLCQAKSTYNTSTYSWLTNTSYFNVIGGIQRWTVPQTGNYTIDAYGARGGQSAGTGSGGAGARSLGTFALTSGQVIAIAVGQKKLSNHNLRHFCSMIRFPSKSGNY